MFIRLSAGAAALLLVSATPSQAQVLDPAFSRFERSADGAGVTIDYQAWSDLLRDIVLDVGLSDRQAARGRMISTGSRMSGGSSSRYRFEGNRVIYHLLGDDYLQALTDYRQELESLPDTVDFARLSSNEQLAYWLNLHNVAVMEQIALQYPVNHVDRLRAHNGEPLFEAKILTVQGARLSLNDIRLRIVYPLWRDPLVMYGFFNGAVGGPNIRRSAYTGADVWRQLDLNAREFVNALRGVEGWGSALLVSTLYAEAGGVLFPGGDDALRAHLLDYARAEVAAQITPNRILRPTTADWRVADMLNGSSRCGGIHAGAIQTVTFDTPGAPPIIDPNTRCDVLPATAQALLSRVVERRQRLFREGVYGEVYVRDIPTDPEGANRE